MTPFLDRIRTRLLPAVLTASGVALLAAGLMSWTDPVDAGPPPVASATPSSPSSAPVTPSPSPTSPGPVDSPSPSSEPSVPPDRLASRVVVPALGIDMPVITPPGGPTAYPPCNVAMYFPDLFQPGQGRATYLYAHARTGMFLPILEASRIENGKRMLGMLVQVYTSDDMLFLYEIVEVRRNQTTLDDALAAEREELWLQTSEGPRGTPGKTQVIARALSSGPADPAEAHPSASPVACG